MICALQWKCYNLKFMFVFVVVLPIFGCIRTSNFHWTSDFCVFCKISVRTSKFQFFWSCTSHFCVFVQKNNSRFPFSSFFPDFQFFPQLQIPILPNSHFTAKKHATKTVPDSHFIEFPFYQECTVYYSKSFFLLHVPKGASNFKST